MKRLAIIGAGDLGVQLAHLARTTGQYVPVAFFDDMQPAGAQIDGITVYGAVDALAMGHAAGDFDCVVIGIGYRHLALRQALYRRFAGQMPFATLVHPSAIVDPTCRLGEGAVVYSGCVLDLGASVGANALLNAGCIVAHHSHVGAHSFLSPAVSVAGFVDIEPGCVLGIGTVVIDNVRIASGARTGAGAVVTSNLEQPGLYLGVPARFAKGPATP